MSWATEQVVLVVGAAMPAGRALSEAFANDGATLIVTDVNSSHLGEVVEHVDARTGTRPMHRLLRVTDPAEWSAAVADIELRYGRLDTVVCAAEFDPAATWQEAGADDWSLALDINLQGVVNGLNAVLPALRRSSGTFVVVTTEPEPAPGRVLQVVARSAARAFARAVQDELAPEVVVATAVIRAGDEDASGDTIVAALRSGETHIMVDMQSA